MDLKSYVGKYTDGEAFYFALLESKLFNVLSYKNKGKDAAVIIATDLLAHNLGTPKKVTLTSFLKP